MTLNWEQFMALPQFTDVSDFHCVTTWSQFDMEFEGVAFSRWQNWSSQGQARAIFSSPGTTTTRPILRSMIAWTTT